MQGFEGNVQGYSREAEGEAQPVQEADLITQQMSCQQQSADFLWAEEQGGVSRRRELEGRCTGHTQGVQPNMPKCLGLGSLACRAELRGPACL